MANPSHSDENTNQAEALRLAEAFRIFNQASEELSSAYTALQAQVAQLTMELAAANGELRRQYQEKAAVTERLAMLLDALPAGVVLVDGQGRIGQSNPAATDLLGGELTPGSDWGAFSAARLLAGETPGEFDCKGLRLAVTVTPLDSAGGRIVLLHDVTEAHRLRSQAARNERFAAMGEMAAQLAHQLRTPLAAALLYAGNLEMPVLAETARISIAQKTVARLQHLEHLIQDMLLFARGDALGRETFRAGELMQELRVIFEPLAAERGIAFTVADVGSELALTGNRKALAGALTNLLENALQAVGNDGKISIGTHREAESLCFSVKDNGRGMNAETRARLFEPFFTTRSEGTGLGLAIARGVARAHGGTIDVSSTPGAGSEFVLSLPLLRRDTGREQE